MVARDSQLCRLLFGLAILALSARSAVAQVGETDWGPEDGAYDCRGPCTGPRTLGGHTFVPSTLVDWAFIVSRVASTSSVGVAQIELNPQRLGMALGLEGTDDFVFADQSILGTVAIGSRLSLGVRAQASLVVPTDRNGALLIGQHGMYGGNAVAAVRLIRSGRFQATALVEGGWLRPMSVVPARLPGSPFQEGDLESVRPALALAYAFTPRIGIQASGSYAWQWFDVIQKDTFRTVTADAALTFDVHPVPLTLLAAAQYSHAFGEVVVMDAMDAVFGTGESKVWGEAGAVYRGIEELDLAAAFDLRLDDVDQQTRWFGQLRIAYYFL